MAEQIALPNVISIVDSLSRLEYTISSFESIASFLLDFSPGKRPIDRFLSYLITLGLLRPTRFTWASNLYEMASTYFLDPLVTNGEWTISDSVRASLQTSSPWFTSLFTGVTDIAALRSTRIPRICAVLLAGNPEFDGARLVFVAAVCFAVSEQFRVDAGFSSDFAEGIAFYLARAIAQTTQRLPSVIPEQAAQYHARVSSLIYTLAVRNWRYLDVNKVGFGFATVYEGALFARQINKLSDVFVLWDQLLAKLAILPELVTALTISAIQNLTITDDTRDVGGLVVSHKEWNVRKVITDALNILEHRRSLTQSICARCCPWIPMLHGWSIKQ
jgi:hypothetical protein